MICQNCGLSLHPATDCISALKAEHISSLKAGLQDLAVIMTLRNELQRKKLAIEQLREACEAAIEALSNYGRWCGPVLAQLHFALEAAKEVRDA